MPVVREIGARMVGLPISNNTRLQTLNRLIADLQNQVTILTDQKADLEACIVTKDETLEMLTCRVKVLEESANSEINEHDSALECERTMQERWQEETGKNAGLRARNAGLELESQCLKTQIRKLEEESGLMRKRESEAVAVTKAITCKMQEQKEQHEIALRNKDIMHEEVILTIAGQVGAELKSIQGLYELALCNLIHDFKSDVDDLLPLLKRLMEECRVYDKKAIIRQLVASAHGLTEWTYGHATLLVKTIQPISGCGDIVQLRQKLDGIQQQKLRNNIVFVKTAKFSDKVYIAEKLKKGDCIVVQAGKGMNTEVLQALPIVFPREIIMTLAQPSTFIGSVVPKMERPLPKRRVILKAIKTEKN